VPDRQTNPREHHLSFQKHRFFLVVFFKLQSK
jgi:hypothetical protein